MLIDRLRGYFLTQQGEPRKASFAGTGFTADDCASPASWKRHRDRAADLAPAVAETVRAFRRDLNVVMSRGVWRIFAVALTTYQQTLEAHALLDFSGVLERALDLLKQMDEFARSRYRLEARYHHVLVDEFQDTSRAQWELVAQLVRSWGEGLGASADALSPSIFIVGDRKQSIYGFRDAEVAVLEDAAGFIEALRPDGHPRQAITVSFRAVPALLDFVNDVFDDVDKAPERRDAFRYDESDRFPVSTAAHLDGPDDAAVWRHCRRARRSRAAAEAVADGDRPVAVVRDGARSADRRPARGQAGGHRHPVPVAREPSRIRGGARASRRFDLRLQGSRLFRRARNSGRGRAASDFWRNRRRISGPPRFCDRGSCGCPTTAIRRLSPRLAAAVAGPDAPEAFGALELSKISWCWPRARGESRAGWRGGSNHAGRAAR